MRIAFITGRFPLISETFILNQLVGLLERGHDVDVYATRAAGGKAHADFETHRIAERTRYRDMPSNVILRVLKSFAVARRGMTHNAGAVGRTLNPFRVGKEALSLKLLYSAAPILESGKTYDIVHGHFGPRGLMAVDLRRAGVFPPSAKIITTFYGYDAHRYSHDHGPDAFRRLFADGELILALSDFMKGQIRAMGCPERKMRVHRVGTDLRKAVFTPRLPPADGVVRFGSVSRFVEKKGLEYAIRAVAQLPPTCRLTYDIIGDGQLRPQLEALIRDLGVADRVRLLGFKTQEEVTAIFRDIHVQLAPSVTTADGDREETPVAILDSMARGMPLITTLDLINDDVDGHRVPERDPAALAAKMRQVIEHPERWEAVGRAARNRIEQEFDVSKLNDRLVDIYQDVLSGKMPA